MNEGFAMSRMITLMMLLLIFAGQTWADVYRICYSANSNELPEQRGWEYLWGNWQGMYEGDPASREFVRDQGEWTLKIDSTHDPLSFTYHDREKPDGLDPGSGELFVMQWRLKIVEVTDGPYDAGMGMHSDTGWAVGFGFSEDTVMNVYYPEATATIAQGEFHDYVLWSENMRTYDLLIDGDLAIDDGLFYEGFGQSHVGWGDVLQGGAGVAEWSYFSFGVLAKHGSFAGAQEAFSSEAAPKPVPEPRSFYLMTLALLACRGARRSRVFSSQVSGKEVAR
ncbi:MAG: hypothetical protein KKB50_06140 [Planctomycetes bacterium]|nr:hypothetical protein [Planctomycetota bacterium]